MPVALFLLIGLKFRLISWSARCRTGQAVPHLFSGKLSPEEEKKRIWKAVEKQRALIS